MSYPQKRSPMAPRNGMPYHSKKCINTPVRTGAKTPIRIIPFKMLTASINPSMGASFLRKGQGQTHGPHCGENMEYLALPALGFVVLKAAKRNIHKIVKELTLFLGQK